MSAADDYAETLEYLRILAQQHFAQWWSSIQTEGVPDAAVRSIFAEVARLYGEQAAAAAVDYLVLSRSLDETLAGLPLPKQANPATFDQASGAFNWAVRSSVKAGVFDDTKASQKLDRILVRLVSQPAHETVVGAVRRDGTAFARVPEPGACPFCMMLASKGASYETRETASRTKKALDAEKARIKQKQENQGQGKKPQRRVSRPAGSLFHDNCRCLIIEVKRDGSDLPQINKDLQQLWKQSNKPTADEFAKMLAERKKQGDVSWPALKRVEVPRYRGDGMSKVFPGEALPKDLNRGVAHVLYGWRDRSRKGDDWVPHSERSRMGHTWDSQRKNASKFPKSWSDQKIADAIRDTLEDPSHYMSGGGRREVWKTIDGVLIKVDYTKRPDGIVVFNSAYPVASVKKEAKSVHR